MCVCQSIRSIWILGLLLASAAILRPQVTKAAETGREVSLYVTVEEKDKLIGGLTQDNFRLFEDGRSQPFKLERPQSPVSIVLLVEYSRSSWPFLNDIDYAIQGFMEHAPQGNWYALVTFSHEVHIDVDFTKQRGRIAQEFSSLPEPEWDEIDTYDAVCRVLDILGRLPGRRVLILIGSGLDSYSAHTIGDLKKKIEATDAIVYGLGVGSLFRGEYEPYLSTMTQMDLLQAQAFIKMLADKSGGDAWFPEFAQAFPDDMAGVMQYLKYQYRLVYRPQVARDDKFHRIKVEAFSVKDHRRMDYKVRVREGWRF